MKWFAVCDRLLLRIISQTDCQTGWSRDVMRHCYRIKVRRHRYTPSDVRTLILRMTYSEASLRSAAVSTKTISGMYTVSSCSDLGGHAIGEAKATIPCGSTLRLREIKRRGCGLMSDSHHSQECAPSAPGGKVAHIHSATKTSARIAKGVSSLTHASLNPTASEIPAPGPHA